MGRPCILAVVLAAGCSGAAPEGASSPLGPPGWTGGGLVAIEGVAGRIARLSPGARAALGLRALLLGALRPGRGSVATVAAPGLVGDDPFDLLRPEVIDAGVFTPGGAALRFPEIGIGVAIGRRAPEPADLDVDLGAATPTACGPALVGAYRAGATLLVLDAGGGFVVSRAGLRRAGRYSCDGDRLLLEAHTWRGALDRAPGDALRDDAGNRYTALGGPS